MARGRISVCISTTEQIISHKQPVSTRARILSLFRPLFPTNFFRRRVGGWSAGAGLGDTAAPSHGKDRTSSSSPWTSFPVQVAHLVPWRPGSPAGCMPWTLCNHAALQSEDVCAGHLALQGGQPPILIRHNVWCCLAGGRQFWTLTGLAGVGACDTMHRRVNLCSTHTRPEGTHQLSVTKCPLAVQSDRIARRHPRTALLERRNDVVTGKSTCDRGRPDVAVCRKARQRTGTWDM